MPSRKELLKDFYSKYSPETQLTEERLTAIDNKYGDDNKALLTDFYSKYAPEVELTDERFEAISKKYSLASGGGDVGKQQGSTEPSEQSQDTTTTPSSETPLEQVKKPINEDTQGSVIIGDKYYSPSGVAAEPEYSQLAVDKSIDRNVKAYDSELKASYNEMAEIRNNINSLKEQVGELDIMKKRLSKTPTPMPSLGASYQGALEGYNQNVEQINQKASELNSAIGALSEQDKAAVKRYNEILKNKTSYDEMKMQESEDVKNLQRAVSKEMIDNLPSTMRLGARFLGGVIMGGKNIAASVMEAFGTGAPTFTEEDIANAPTEEIRNLYSNIREKHLKESKEWFDKANELKLSAEETKTQYGLITDLEELGEDVTPLNIINFAVTSAAEQMPQIPLAIATLGVGTYEQTMGSIMGSVIGEIVKENKAKGMSDEDAFNAALEDERLNRGAAEGAAVGVAALDLLGASKFLGGIGKKSAQKYLQSQLKTSGAKRFATGVFTEEATEIAQEFVEAGGRGALRGDGFVEGVSEVTAEDVANIAAKTFFGVSGFSAVNAYTNDGKIDNENVNMLFKAAKDDKTLKALEEQIALKRINGDITEEQYQERIQQLADDIAVVSTIPNEVSEDNRAKAIELQNKYNEKMLAKSEASDAFKDLYNEDLESIKNELQSLTSKPKQPTETSTTSKTDNAELQQEITPEQEVKRTPFKEIPRDDFLEITKIIASEDIEITPENRESKIEEIYNSKEYKNWKQNKPNFKPSKKITKPIEEEAEGSKVVFRDKKGNGANGTLSIKETPSGKVYASVVIGGKKEVVGAKATPEGKVSRRVEETKSDDFLLGESGNTFKDAKVNYDSNENPTSITLTKKDGSQLTIKNKEVAENLHFDRMKKDFLYYNEFKPKQDAKEQQGGEMRVESKPQEPKGESNSNLPEVNETELQDGKKEQKIKTATSGVAKAIRGAKFTRTISDLNKLQSDPTGLLKVAWDGALEIVATTIEAGGTVAQAIKNGVDHIKTTEWYNNLSDSGKKSAEKKVATAIKESASEHYKKIKQDKREITKKANRANERLKGGKFFNKTIIVGNFMSALKNLGNITDEDLLLEINNELNAIMRRGVADVNTDRINDLTRRVLEKQPEETKLTAKERAKKAMASVRGRNVNDMAQLVSFELAADKAMNELDNALTVGEITEDEYNKALEQISEAYEDNTEGLSDADSYTALIQNKGNLTRTKNAIDKAFSNGEITEDKKAELEAGLNAASKKFEADKEAVIKENNESAKEFFKNNKSTEVAETFNLSKPQYIVVDKLFDVFKRAEVFVDDLAISDKLAKIADAMEQGYFPLKDINEVYRSILSKGRSKELISVLDSAGKNISKKGSEKISLLLSATVLGFKSGKFGRGIKESAVLEKYVYGPLLEAIGQSEAASKQIIDDFFKSTKMSFIGSLNPVKRKQRKRNIILAGVFMNQLTNQDEKGSSKKVGIMFPKQSGSDGSKLDIGSVDWLGIILGKEAAINAAKGEMNPTTRSALLKGKLKSGYGKADLKTMEEVWESLPKNEDGSVDYDEFFNNSDKYLNEDTRTLIEASQKAFADGYEYISAAKMIRGERLDEIVSYYKRARQGAGDAQIDYNTINSTPNLRVVAGSSINRTSNDVGAIDFNVLNTVTANAIESPKMFNFEINGGLVNSTLGRTSVGTDEKDLVAGMKDDARASVNFNFSRSNAGTLLMNKALGAQYFRVLLEPIRIGIEIFSLTNRALTQVGLKNTALGVLPKVLPIETRSKVVENLENLTGIKLTADTTAQMEQGSPSELSKESRSSIDIRKTRGLPTALRYFMAVPEHIFDVAFAYPTFEKAFRSVTGEDFDANKFKDKDYRADNRQAIVDAMTLAQSEMTTIMSVGAKFSARRNIKIAPITTKRWAYIGADTSAGGVLNYMSTFVFKEGSTVEEAMRFTYDMFRKNGYKLSNSGELTGETFKSDIYRKAAGVVLAGVTYSYMRQLQFLLEKANDDDDDERREAEKLLKSEYGMVYRNGRVKSFKPQDALAGMVTTVADQIGFMFIGTYGQALRLAVIASLSMAYNLLDKSQEKERKMIENILRKRFYTAPVGDSKYAKGQFFAKAIPLMDIGAAEYHAVSGVSKDMVDIGKDLANKKGGLSEDKAAKYRLGLSTLRLFNMALLLNSGVQVPNTRKMERWMEGEIKKKSK